jgi:hypothetical protein
MTPPIAADVLTVGHANQPADRFLALLQGAEVTAVADVRSVPFSRRFPWFSGKALAKRLRTSGIGYLALGDALGGRPRDPSLYCDGVADYDAMAATRAFRSAGPGARRDAAAAPVPDVRRARAARLHRCLLVARALAKRAPGHIFADGTVEPHAATRGTLAGLDGRPPRPVRRCMARLEAAHRRRARAIAARIKA